MSQEVSQEVNASEEVVKVPEISQEIEEDEILTQFRFRSQFDEQVEEIEELEEPLSQPRVINESPFAFYIPEFISNRERTITNAISKRDNRYLYWRKKASDYKAEIENQKIVISYYKHLLMERDESLRSTLNTLEDFKQKIDNEITKIKNSAL